MSDFKCDVCRGAGPGIVFGPNQEKVLATSGAIARVLLEWTGDDADDKQRPVLVDKIAGLISEHMFGRVNADSTTEGFRVCRGCLDGTLDQLDAEAGDSARIEVAIVGGSEKEKVDLGRMLAEGLDLLTNPMAWAARHGAELGARMSARPCGNGDCAHKYSEHELVVTEAEGGLGFYVGRRMSGGVCKVESCCCSKFEEKK
jgi:hypothetical protein